MRSCSSNTSESVAFDVVLGARDRARRDDEDEESPDMNARATLSTSWGTPKVTTTVEDDAWRDVK